MNAAERLAETIGGPFDGCAREGIAAASEDR
jgi:hypothetical protein